MARCGRCALARALLRRAAETPEADPGRAGLFPIDDHVEALLPIEGDVGLVLGLEVARDFIDVGPLEHPAHQRAAKSAPLTTRLDPEQKQVPARALQIALARLPFAPDHLAFGGIHSATPSNCSGSALAAAKTSPSRQPKRIIRAYTSGNSRMRSAASGIA